jgi:hypothetical protein
MANVLHSEQAKVIANLCLSAGQIMEDTSSELALILPNDPAALAARLQSFRTAAEDILALIAAAQALHRRSSSSAHQS